jgi:heme exporter protein C
MTKAASGVGCKDGKAMLLGLMLFLLQLGLWAYGLWGASTEQHQGDVYRIIYLHVPAAFSAFLCALVLAVLSVQSLRNPDRAKPVLYGKAAAEVGVVLTVITLVSGSIWGKPTWGVWWTWDGRLTTTFILFLLYCGYLFLWSALSTPALRSKVCAILGLLIFADVPIIYKSVTWWRTLHQPPSLFQGQSAPMAPEFLVLLLLAIAGMSFCTVWLIWQRGVNLQLQKQCDTLLIRRSVRQ